MYLSTLGTSIYYYVLVYSVVDASLRACTVADSICIVKYQLYDLANVIVMIIYSVPQMIVSETYTDTYSISHANFVTY